MLPWLLLLLPLAIWLVWRSPWGRRTASRARRHGQQVATDWADFTDTSPVAEGEDPRSGRWRGEEKVECGIHFANGRMVRQGPST